MGGSRSGEAGRDGRRGSGGTTPAVSDEEQLFCLELNPIAAIGPKFVRQFNSVELRSQTCPHRFPVKCGRFHLH